MGASGNIRSDSKRPSLGSGSVVSTSYGTASKAPPAASQPLCTGGRAGVFDPANLGSVELNGPIWLHILASSSSFCLHASLTSHAVRPRSTQRHAPERAWPRRLHDAPKPFSLQHLWPVPQRWVPSRPLSSFMVSPEKLHFRRAGSSWPWSNSNTLFINPINALCKSLSFDRLRNYHATCTNVPQDGSWSPQLAMPSCAFLTTIEAMFGSLVLGIPRRGGKRVTGTSDGRLAACHLCGKLHRTCIADIGWCLTFVSAPPIGYDPRAEDLRKHVPPAHHSTPVRGIGRTASRLSHRLYVSTGSSSDSRPVTHCTW